MECQRFPGDLFPSSPEECLIKGKKKFWGRFWPLNVNFCPNFPCCREFLSAQALQSVWHLWSSSNPPQPISANVMDHFPSSDHSCSSFPHPGHKEPPPPPLWSGMKDILWESWNAELPLVQSCFQLRKGRKDLTGKKMDGHLWDSTNFPALKCPQIHVLGFFPSLLFRSPDCLYPMCSELTYSSPSLHKKENPSCK